MQETTADRLADQMTRGHEGVIGLQRGQVEEGLSGAFRGGQGCAVGRADARSGWSTRPLAQVVRSAFCTVYSVDQEPDWTDDEFDHGLLTACYDSPGGMDARPDLDVAGRIAVGLLRSGPVVRVCGDPLGDRADPAAVESAVRSFRGSPLLAAFQLAVTSRQESVRSGVSAFRAARLVVRAIQQANPAILGALTNQPAPPAVADQPAPPAIADQPTEQPTVVDQPAPEAAEPAKSDGDDHGWDVATDGVGEAEGADGAGDGADGAGDGAAGAGDGAAAAEPIDAAMRLATTTALGLLGAGCVTAAGLAYLGVIQESAP